MNGGVGYLIPKSITNLNNSVLRALNIRYQIVRTLAGCNAGKA